MKSFQRNSYLSLCFPAFFLIAGIVQAEPTHYFCQATFIPTQHVGLISPMTLSWTADNVITSRIKIQVFFPGPLSSILENVEISHRIDSTQVIKWGGVNDDNLNLGAGEMKISGYYDTFKPTQPNNGKMWINDLDGNVFAGAPTANNMVCYKAKTDLDLSEIATDMMLNSLNVLHHENRKTCCSVVKCVKDSCSVS